MRLAPGSPDLSLVPRSNAPPPTLAALQQAARRLTGPATAAGVALFAPIEGPLPTCAVYMKDVHANDSNLMDVELVMRYIFTVGHWARWALDGLVLEHGPILQNIILCNDHGDPNGHPRRNVDRFTTQGRKHVVSSIVIANFLASRFGHPEGEEEEEKPDGGRKECIVMQHAARVTYGMRAFLHRICGEDCITSRYTPEADAELQGLWRSLQVYMDIFLTWNVSSKGVQQSIMQSSLLSIRAMTRGLRSGLGMENLTKEGARHLVPSDLVQRLQCAAVLATAITTGSHGASTYPVATCFHPRHPCDAFLRLISGDSSHDFVAMPVHESIAARSLHYIVPCMDPLTEFITSRRYTHVIPSDVQKGDLTPPIQGSILQSSNEALIHNMHCGFDNCAATRSSGYDPARSFLTIVGSSGNSGVNSPWFPGVAGGYKGLLELRADSFWANLQAELAVSSYAAVEQCLVLVRTNFACMFNSYEAKLAQGMMAVDVPRGAVVSAPIIFQHLARMCTDFMRGPVLLCAERHGMAKDVVVPWSQAEASLQEMVHMATTDLPTPLPAMAVIMRTVLQCMDNAARLLDSRLALTRHRMADHRIASTDPVETHFYLRTCLFRRAADALTTMEDGVTPHPMRTFMDGLQLSNTTFTEAGCGAILSDGDPTGILPATRAWILQGLVAAVPQRVGDGPGTRGLVARRLSWWLVHHIPFCLATDAGTPETLAPSLPFLDRLSVVSSICTALLVAISLGYQDPLPPLSNPPLPMLGAGSSLLEGLGGSGIGGRTVRVPTGGGGVVALALFGEGVERETYEWDSSFVERLMLRHPPLQRQYLEHVVRLTGMIALGHGATTPPAEQPGTARMRAREVEVVESAKRFVEGLLVRAMLGVGGEGGDDDAPGHGIPPCIAQAASASLVDTMLLRHLRGVGGWFDAHMAAYGPVYSAYVR